MDQAPGHSGRGDEGRRRRRRPKSRRERDAEEEQKASRSWIEAEETRPMPSGSPLDPDHRSSNSSRSPSDASRRRRKKKSSQQKSHDPANTSRASASRASASRSGAVRSKSARQPGAARPKHERHSSKKSSANANRSGALSNRSGTHANRSGTHGHPRGRGRKKKGASKSSVMMIVFFVVLIAAGFGGIIVYFALYGPPGADQPVDPDNNNNNGQQTTVENKPAAPPLDTATYMIGEQSAQALLETLNGVNEEAKPEDIIEARDIILAQIPNEPRLIREINAPGLYFNMSDSTVQLYLDALKIIMEHAEFKSTRIEHMGEFLANASAMETYNQTQKQTYLELYEKNIKGSTTDMLNYLNEISDKDMSLKVVQDLAADEKHFKVARPYFEDYIGKVKERQNTDSPPSDTDSAVSAEMSKLLQLMIITPNPVTPAPGL